MKINLTCFLIVGALLVTGVTGCSSGAKQENNTDANSSVTAADDLGLLTPGVLKVGAEIGYPPFEFFADDGVTPTGLDIDLGKAVADELGLKWEVENTAFDGIFDGLKADKYDVVISAVTITADRELQFDFSTPYIENWQAIIVKKGETPITGVKGLDGLAVGYQQATTSETYLKDRIATGELSCETNEYAQVLNAFDDLRLGRTNAVICDSTVADGYIAREPDNFEITWLQSSESGAVAETFGICIKKGNAKLQKAINDALQSLSESGQLEEIRKNWL